MEIVNAVYEALVFGVVLFARCLFEGACLHVKLGGRKAVVSRSFLGVLVFGLLGDEFSVVLVLGIFDFHKVKSC